MSSAFVQQKFGEGPVGIVHGGEPEADYARFVLGTASLGLAYGRRRDLGAMSGEQAADILEGAWTLGIRAFDTAESYGLAAEHLSRWLHATSRLSGARVITKVVVSDAARPAALEMACRRFEGAYAVALLTHGASGGRVWEAFRDRAESIGVEPGQSVYSADEVVAAAGAGARRVQAPGNLFDLAQVDAATRVDVPIDVRSVFLQGLLLDTPEAAEARVCGSGRLAQIVRGTAARIGLPPATALMASFLRHLRKHQRLVIGIDDTDQLRVLGEAVRVPTDTADLFGRMIRDAVPDIVPRRILDPRQW